MRLAFLLALGLAGCNDGGPDHYVGAACRDDLDCYDRCETGGDFPGGFCTLSCSDDADCTHDSLCADVNGGICLYGCDLDRHCDFLGPGYECHDRSDIYGDRVGVCIGN